MSLKMYHSKTEIKGAVVKGCPFCGNQNLLISEQKDYEKLCRENGSSLLKIVCRVCNTENTLYDIPDNNYWIGVGFLIAKWNTRCGYEDCGRD